MLRIPDAMEGIDREKLRLAIARGFAESGWSRSQRDQFDLWSTPFGRSSTAAAAVLEAIEKPAPSGEMFADGVRLNGLKVLATHHIRRGLDACVEYLRSQNPWASEKRTPEILQVLEAYGAHAQRVIPQLSQAAAVFDQGEPNFPKKLSQQKAEAVRATIDTIRSSAERPVLRRITEASSPVDPR